MLQDSSRVFSDVTSEFWCIRRFKGIIGASQGVRRNIEDAQLFSRISRDCPGRSNLIFNFVKQLERWLM